MRWFMFAALFALLPCIGCASSGGFALPGATTFPSDGAKIGAGAQGELPPEKGAELCLAMARVMEEKGNDQEAIAEYERALQRNPRLSKAVRRLAVLYDRQGDREHAATAYAEATRAYPKDANLLNDVGYFRYECGDLKEAENYLRQALEINPRHRRAWINLGMALGLQERYEESYQAFVKVLAPAEAHSNLGVLLAQRGKLDEAKRSLKQALALQPDLKQARAVLTVLENATAQPPVPGAGAGTTPPVPQSPERQESSRS